MKKLERIFVYSILLIVSSFLLYYTNNSDFGDQNKTDSPAVTKTEDYQSHPSEKYIDNSRAEKLKTLNPSIPHYVIATLVYIRNHSKAPPDYVGGRKFFNREKRLPYLRNDNYIEWDVHPQRKGKNRGAERLVTSKSTAYFTKDHYDTFIAIKEQ
jgi:ribonuclease T1